MSIQFKVIIKGVEYTCEGYYETGDPSVGLFGGGFCPEVLVRISDGYRLSDEEIEALGEPELQTITDAYAVYLDEKYPQGEEELADWETDQYAVYPRGETNQ